MNVKTRCEIQLKLTKIENLLNEIRTDLDNSAKRETSSPAQMLSSQTDASLRKCEWCHKQIDQEDPICHFHQKPFHYTCSFQYEKQFKEGFDPLSYSEAGNAKWIKPKESKCQFCNRTSEWCLCYAP